MLLPRQTHWALLLTLVALPGCRGHAKPVWQHGVPLKGLSTVTSVITDPPTDQASTAIQVRPALAATQVLLEQHLVVSQAGETEFPIPERTEAWFGIRTADVQLRDAHGAVHSRTAQLRQTGSTLMGVVDFAVAEVGASYDMRIAAALPWPPLQTETEDLVVPPNAHLRFGITLQVPEASVVATRGHFRVSLKARTGAVATLYEADLAHERQQPHPAWRDVEADLSQYAGQTARLVFETTRDVEAHNPQLRLPVPLISEPFLVSASGRASRRNVVLISIDTLRADHLGAYGYPRPTSPLIDRLAAGGVLFDNAFAVFAETSASHMTMFTSLYPSVHGVSITQWGNRALPPWQSTLAEVLRREHYVTAAVTEDGLLAHPLGFARGFTHYTELHKPGDLLGAAAVADRVFDSGAQWLRAHRDDLFFLFLHTYQVHERTARGDIYDHLRDSFRRDGLPAVNDSGAAMAREYDAAIRYTDDALASVIRALEELQLTHNTLLLITSDHGEEFGTHGAYGHGSNLSDFALHVPLILWAPDFVPAGRHVAAQVGLIDLPPTLLDLLGLPPLPQAQGRSVAPAVRDGAQPTLQPLFFELGDTLRAVRYPDYKVIAKPAGDAASAQYYDLRRDPGEVAAGADAQERVQEALTRIREHDNEAIQYRERLASGAGTRAPEGAAVPLDAQTKERLRALGYNVAQP